MIVNKIWNFVDNLIKVVLLQRTQLFPKWMFLEKKLWMKNNRSFILQTEESSLIMQVKTLFEVKFRIKSGLSPSYLIGFLSLLIEVFKTLENVWFNIRFFFRNFGLLFSGYVPGKKYKCGQRFYCETFNAKEIGIQHRKRLQIVIHYVWVLSKR